MAAETTSSSAPPRARVGGGRVGVLRVPDWPVVVARQTGALPAGGEQGAPGAIVHALRLVACDEQARADGVRVGMRVRDAQAASPMLALAPADPVGEALAFERVVRAVLAVVPAAQPIGDGALAFRMRGASRFYGSESRALEAVRGALDPLGLSASFGVADDRFTAELAAQLGRETIVPAGRSRDFLGPLPVGVLGDDELPGMLHRLGVHTLGGFAQLPDDSVRDRFGEAGLVALTRARGGDDRRVDDSGLGEERALRLVFEPGIEGVQELALAVREPVERFVRQLAEQRLVCSEIRIVLRGEEGRVSERLWRQPGFLRAGDIVDRMRWQLTEGDLGSALVEVQALPERLDADAEHMPGLWGGGDIDDRTKHALERLQGMLGREAVLTATPGGGRLLAERGVLTPWGDAAPAQAAGPWPGALPPPRPAVVFRPPLPVRLLDAAGAPVEAAALDVREGAPAAFSPPAAPRRRVVAWAGPWPIRRRNLGDVVHRVQILDGEGEAWVLLQADGAWLAEGRYA
ncbi:DNA polymerase Y family protein [Agrococcus sp. SCSIO52902]|uniref:Y-family DNA polymerase n=1 Tax=Agrococcus sp. SCSIO52902 TaxID=2933290 RepID=UPI001FF151D0|nr:DNA polymerase Y family protein [Agrococcus sp. SCSIO52902]UOV99743.1 DNA polymerase Y family protein [Agrococcus sp. SCSIO52902]